MTDPFIHDLAKVLAERLAEPATTADDFVRLASVGEPIRRAVALLDKLPAPIVPVLAAYELALSKYVGPIPSTLDADAMAVSAALEAYRGDDDQDGDLALSLILELDAIESVTVAAERSGHLPTGTADALAARLEQSLAGLSYRAPHLAQLAEDRWLTVGDDPDVVGAYGWLDTLAEAAPSRVRISAVVKTAATNERRIDEALQILSRPRPAEHTRRSVGRLPPFAVAKHVQHAQFATTPIAVPKQTPLLDQDDLSIFLEDTDASLHLVVAFSPPLWVDDVRITLNGSALARVNGGPHEFRFTLPDVGGQLRFELQIEDEAVVHELELRRQP